MLDDSIVQFSTAVSDPYWLVFAVFVTGVAIGWLTATLQCFADEMISYFKLRRIKSKEAAGSGKE